MRRALAVAVCLLALLAGATVFPFPVRPLYAQGGGPGHPTPVQTADPASADVDAAALCRFQPGTGVITGTVTVSATGGLADAFLSLDTIYGVSVETTRTSVDGVYEFTNLSAGQYSVSAMPFGFSATGIAPTDLMPQYYNSQASPGAITPVSVQDGQTTPNINFALTPGVVLKGRVTDATSGAGLEGVSVNVWKEDNGGMAAGGETDATGHYTMSVGLAPGLYQLEFVPAPGDDEHAPMWYNGKFAGDVPDTVQIGVNSPVIINQALASEDIGQIVGTVTKSDGGAPVAFTYVQAYNLDGDRVNGDVTGVNGIYTIPVPSGIYKVQAFAGGSGLDGDYAGQFYANASTFEDADTVDIGPGDIDIGNDIALARGVRVIGRVTSANSGQGLDDVGVRLARAGANFLDVSGNGFTDANGYYTTTAVPAGDYTVEFSPVLNRGACEYVEEYYNDKSNEDDATLLSLAGTQVITDVNASLALGGVVAGRVTRADDGNGIRAFVSLIDNNDESLAHAIVGETGYYVSTAAPPGTYKVGFFPSVPDLRSKWYNQKPSRSQADLVNLQAGSAAIDINAELDKGQNLFTPLILR